MSIIKVIPVTDPGNRLVAGPARRVRVITDPGNRLVAGRIIRVYAVAEGERAIQAGPPIDVYEVNESNGLVTPTPIYPVYVVEGTLGGGLDTEYLTVESSYSAQPSDAWRNAASDLFVDIRAALGITTLSDAFDFMYILAHEVAADALINIVNPGTHNATNVNAMAFEANRGVTGDGASSHLDTNFNPSTQGVNYQQNSACIGIYSRTNVDTNNMTDMGGQDNSTRTIRMAIRNSDTFISGVNGNESGLVAGNLDSRSLFTANRSASNAVQGYKAGVLIDTGSGASAALPNVTLFIGAYHASALTIAYSTRQYAFALAGRSMDATEQADFYTAIQTFMTAIGAQV
jgi:hypothetical protein